MGYDKGYTCERNFRDIRVILFCIQALATYEINTVTNTYVLYYICNGLYVSNNWILEGIGIIINILWVILF